MNAEHRARLRPLQPETVWALEGDCLVERRGARERRYGLDGLRQVRRVAGGAVLLFPRGRVLIPSRSFGEGLRAEDRSESFETLLATLPPALPASRAARFAEPFLWIVALMAGGVVLLLAFSAMAGFWQLGVALAARLAFVTLLACAALPWLTRRR